MRDYVPAMQKRYNFVFTEQVFYLASLDAGYGSHAEDKARELYIIWARRGYEGLPRWTREFIETRVSDKEYVCSMKGM